MWEQRALLRNVADSSFLGWEIDSPSRRKKRSAADFDFSGREFYQTSDSIEDCGLARARWPKNRCQPSFENHIDIQFVVGQRYPAPEQHLINPLFRPQQPLRRPHEEERQGDGDG